MPKNIGYKPSARKMRSGAGEPSVPKPRNQGTAARSGPGAGQLRPAIRKKNSRT